MIRRISLMTALLVLCCGARASAATFDDPTHNHVTTASAGSPAKAWDVYPMQIPVTGMAGAITEVKVVVRNWSQTDGHLSDFAVQSPSGTFVKLVSDAGDASVTPASADHLTIVFDQGAAESIREKGPLGPASTTVVRRPTDYGSTPDDFRDPAAGAGAAPADLSTLNGQEPNGTWRLFLVTESISSTRQAFIDGWSLELTSAEPPPVASAPSRPTPAPATPLPTLLPPDRSAPLVTRIATAGTRLRAATRGGSVGTTGASIGFRLSEAATVAFDVDRLVAGRRSGGRCVTGRRRGTRCTKAVAVPGDFRFAGKAGTNVLRFTGRVGGRALSPGRYRITGVATDAAGNAAKPFSVTVTVLSRRSRAATAPPGR